MSAAKQSLIFNTLFDASGHGIWLSSQLDLSKSVLETTTMQFPICIFINLFGC